MSAQRLWVCGGPLTDPQKQVPTMLFPLVVPRGAVSVSNFYPLPSDALLVPQGGL